MVAGLFLALGGLTIGFEGMHHSHQKPEVSIYCPPPQTMDAYYPPAFASTPSNDTTCTQKESQPHPDVISSMGVNPTVQMIVGGLVATAGATMLVSVGKERR